jgi:hypothetical protein
MSGGATTCRSCGASIVWLKTTRGSLMPVDAGSVKAGDVEFDSKQHVSHFASCQQADQWRKPR